MKTYEVKIEILDKDYVDTLIVALVRQGFKVYFDINNNLCYVVPEEDIRELTDGEARS